MFAFMLMLWGLFAESADGCVYAGMFNVDRQVCLQGVCVGRFA